MTAVFDACAIIALMKAEEGGAQVDALIADAGNVCLIHAVNSCEVFYDTLRAVGEVRALTALDRLRFAGLQIREDMDSAFWQDAGRIKADLRRISLADCMAIALARREGATLLTTDRHELQPVADAGLCRVQFIR